MLHFSEWKLANNGVIGFPRKKIIRKLGTLFHYRRILLTVFTLAFSLFFIVHHNEEIQGQIVSQSVNNTSIIDCTALSDRTLKIETVATGFAFPTGIAFLGNNEILLLEKNTGNVFRIVNGIVSNLVVRLNVSIEDER